MLKYKSILFIICSLLIMQQKCISQHFFAAKLGVSQGNYFKTGSNSPYFSVTDKPGIAVCVSMSYMAKKNDYLNLGFGIDYRPKKTKLIFTKGSKTSYIVKNYDFTLNFLYVSFIPEVNFGEKIKVLLSCEPYLGFLLSSSGKGTEEHRAIFEETEIEEIDPKKEYEGLFWGLIPKIGLRFPVSNKIDGIVQLAYSIPSFFQPDIKSNDKFATVGLSYSFD